MNSNDKYEFIAAYLALSRAKQAHLHFMLLRYAVTDLIKHPGATKLQQAAQTFYTLTIPDVIYFAGLPALVVSALIVWAWALASNSPFVWLSFACLSAAAWLNRPKLADGDDHHNDGGLSF